MSFFLSDNFLVKFCKITWNLPPVNKKALPMQSQ